VTAVLAPPRLDDARPRTESGSSWWRAAPWLVLAAIIVIGAVLRVWWATSFGLSFDEAFTAMAARHSVGGLFSYLRHVDSHPPLDYLIRMPFAHAGASDLAVRMPSIVFSMAALTLFGVWMRDRGRFGLIATAFMAVNGFQVVYGAEARMYALLELLGVAAAMLADHWYRSPRRWHAGVAGTLVLLALCDHASGFLLLGGMLAVAGVRRDRDAWRWRAGVVGGLAVWAPLWGPSMLAQLRGHHSSWIAPTTMRAVFDTIASTVTFQDRITTVVVLAVLGGALVLWRLHRRLAQVWFALGVAPFAAAAVIGLFTPFFLNRTLAVASWAPVVAVAALVDALFRRWRAAGAAALVFVLLLILPSTLLVIQGTWEYDYSSDHVAAMAEPGDVVAVIPAWYRPLIDWRIGVRSPQGARTVHLSGIDDVHAMILRGHPPTGRIWAIAFTGLRESYAGFERCAPDWTDHVMTVSCLRSRTR
jgi:uncharacterized membrane protein